MGKGIIAVLCLCASLFKVQCFQNYRSEEDIKFRHRRAFSDVQDRRFSSDAKHMILDLHNFYRSRVTPPAADMKLMEWDEELEHLAQLYADQCRFQHGKPRSPYSKGEYGQNLYIGSDHTGFNATRLWYRNGDKYDVRTQNCNSDSQCREYVQMAWARSSLIGCGVSKCNTQYLAVCHYFESAFRGQEMYTIGEPCSQCTDENETLCWNNLCISKGQCERYRHFCEEEASCNLECHNCGLLNTTTCQCECPDGWDSRDCSRPCQDEHEKCGKRPGFPDGLGCSLFNNSVRDKYCRKMCGQCNAALEDSWNICCEGKLCEKGYVLNTSTCSCKKLCPGPLCDGYESEEEIYPEETDLIRQKELLLIEKEEFLKRKEKLLEEKEDSLNQKELYLKEKEKFLKKQERRLQRSS